MTLLINKLTYFVDPHLSTSEKDARLYCTFVTRAIRPNAVSRHSIVVEVRLYDAFFSAS